MKELIIDGHSLSIHWVHQIAVAKPGEIKLSLCPSSLERMEESRRFVLSIVEKGEPVYGINTGFGALANKHIPKKDLSALQLNLVRSHCTGVGEPFSLSLTRAIMVLRANCLASGYSGVNPEAVELLLAFLNRHISPVVPKKGSVGASGDLAPLAHIALALIGEGEVHYHGKIVNSQFALENEGLKPLILGPKDGLALINGTAVMAALGAFAVSESQQLMKLADLCAAYTLDGLKGTTKAYDPLIASVKPHPGQLQSTANLNKILSGSQIIHSHENCGKVQDPYSLRCVPQVHGACRQTIAHCAEVISTELNSVTDNPLIFASEQRVVSGGNFHGEALALAMDYLAMGLSEFGNISERRIEKMMNPTFSDLPAFLIKDSGLNSGLMIAHVTAAALASENKIYCHPASVDSIPTSTDKEDHVSMGVTSGRKLNEILFNVKQILAIELLCASQALDFQRPLVSSPVIEKIHQVIRQHVSFIEVDRTFYKDIQKIVRLIDSGDIINSAQSIVRELQ